MFLCRFFLLFFWWVVTWICFMRFTGTYKKYQIHHKASRKTNSSQCAVRFSPNLILVFFLFIALLCQCQSWSLSLWVCFCAVADVTGVVAWWFVGLRAARGRLLTRQSGPNRKLLICTVLWSKINFVQFWKKTNVNISTMYFTEKKGAKYNELCKKPFCLKFREIFYTW